MSYFSRVIARPIPVQEQASPARAATLEGLQGALSSEPSWKFQRVADIPLPLQKFRHLYASPESQSSRTDSPVSTLGSDDGHSMHPTASTGMHFDKPFPRLFLLPRGGNFRRVPSLVDDDSATESSISCSPPSASPPPTACSTMAVLGSAHWEGTFADDYDRPEADPDFMRKQLSADWILQYQAHLRYGEYWEGDNVAGAASNVMADEEHAQPAAEAAPEETIDVVEDRPATPGSPVEPSEGRASRLRERVKTPPALNASAIRAHDILVKLMYGAYDVEVGNVDGSALSDAGSGFEADDEDGFGFGESRKMAHSSVMRRTSDREAVTEAETQKREKTVVACGDGPRKSLKKTYAAVVASSLPAPVPAPAAAPVPLAEERGAPKAGDVPAISMKETNDWTTMFEMRGPLVEATEA
ncbi:hypothetical protein C8Q79DRAFT_1008316 [Trametes meyenii]|nr:hypothetical protein C8Q79DRAFT_1008316 [Trametes meyenii]